MLIAPLTSVRGFAPPDCSFVVPPALVSNVFVPSERVMVEPGVAEALRLKTRWATLSPGAAPFSVNGIRFVDSWKVSSNETDPADEGLDSNVGVRVVVI